MRLFLRGSSVVKPATGERLTHSTVFARDGKVAIVLAVHNSHEIPSEVFGEIHESTHAFFDNDICTDAEMEEAEQRLLSKE